MLVLDGWIVNAIRDKENQFTLGKLNFDVTLCIQNKKKTNVSNQNKFIYLF